MSIRDPVYTPEAPISHIYFPVSGVYSLVNPLQEGQTIEVATVGKEGFLGVPAFLGAENDALLAFCQVEGRCFRMVASEFKKLAEAQSGFRRVLMRYTQGLFTQISQTAACNRAHGIERRCARWLLMTQDRVGASSFGLSVEFLAQMLGVRQGAASEAANGLQISGLIEYSRGIVNVLDRDGLERTSCECYGVIRREFERLLGV